MNEIDYLRILKWIIIVLIAGFIGQFGKSFAKHIMTKAREKKLRLGISGNADKTPLEPKKIEKPANREVEAVEPEQSSDTEDVKEKAKREKKAAKALVKQQKKEAKLIKEENN
jgi:hypothetical protein